MLPSANAIRFYLTDQEGRFFLLDAPSNALVLGEASVTSGTGAPNLRIHVDNVKGKFLYANEIQGSLRFPFETLSIPSHANFSDYDLDYEDIIGEWFEALKLASPFGTPKMACMMVQDKQFLSQSNNTSI